MFRDYKIQLSHCAQSKINTRPRLGGFIIALTVGGGNLCHLSFFAILLKGIYHIYIHVKQEIMNNHLTKATKISVKIGHGHMG